MNSFKYPRIVMADFAPWRDEFGLTVDAAADDWTARLPKYWTPKVDGLQQDWTGERVWCHPPFEHIDPWIRKASTSNADLVCMLVPSPETITACWEPWIARVQADWDERLISDIRVYRPGHYELEYSNGKFIRPTYTTNLLIYGAP